MTSRPLHYQANITVRKSKSDILGQRSHLPVILTYHIYQIFLNTISCFLRQLSIFLIFLFLNSPSNEEDFPYFCMHRIIRLASGCLTYISDLTTQMPRLSHAKPCFNGPRSPALCLSRLLCLFTVCANSKGSGEIH